MKRRSIFPDRPLTGQEVGLVIVIAVLVVLLCAGLSVLSFLVPPPPA